MRSCYHCVISTNRIPESMRFINWICQWRPAILVLSGVNLILLIAVLVRDWNFRRWLFIWELYAGPNTLSDHALAMHLGLLQATVVGIGVGITVAGVIGYRSLHEEAVKKAEKKAEETTKNYLANLGLEGPIKSASPSVDSPTGTDRLDQEPGK